MIIRLWPQKSDALTLSLALWDDDARLRVTGLDGNEGKTHADPATDALTDLLLVKVLGVTRVVVFITVHETDRCTGRADVCHDTVTGDGKAVLHRDVHDGFTCVLEHGVF